MTPLGVQSLSVDPADIFWRLAWTQPLDRALNAHEILQFALIIKHGRQKEFIVETGTILAIV